MTGQARVSIDELIEAIRGDAECAVRPPAGMPSVDEGHVLPDDLRRFYELCGGVELFPEEGVYSSTIVGPAGLVLANPVIWVGLREEEMAATRGHPSWSWYIVAKAPNAQWLTIDLDPARLGTCYDSFRDSHPVDSDTIALSFTEPLRKLYEGRGGYWYWLEEGFELGR